MNKKCPKDTTKDNLRYTYEEELGFDNRKGITISFGEVTVAVTLTNLTIVVPVT